MIECETLIQLSARPDTYKTKHELIYSNNGKDIHDQKKRTAYKQIQKETHFYSCTPPQIKALHWVPVDMYRNTEILKRTDTYFYKYVSVRTHLYHYFYISIRTSVWSAT